MWQLLFPLWYFWSTVQAHQISTVEKPVIIRADLYENPSEIQEEKLASSFDFSALRPVLNQDEEVKLNSSILSAIYDSDNFILHGHFNPERQDKLAQKITDPVLNLYGIEELVSLGVSDFSGSSRNRIKNIKAGMQKFDGIVVPKGAQFSFNDILKSVEPEEGFVKEKVVLNGKGTYALGGGICQLSTTIYRAALNAGLPIDMRRGHTYAYDKYLPYGLDATIYLGAQDLIFTNDTEADLLIKPYIDGSKLLVGFFGTKDGRIVKIDRKVINQYRHGGLATRWSRIVTKNDEVVTESIYSSYKAIY